MLSPEDSREALLKLFRQQPVADLEALCAVLKTSSRMSVFRRLSAIGYVSSYSHSGRYYTLTSVPEYDTDGLWRCRGVCFSQHGTLRDTVQQLVHISEAGRTHPELALCLQVRVHNALLDLVRHKRVGREDLGSIFVYVSNHAKSAAAQVARRRELGAVQPTAPGAPIRTALVVEILLEIVHGSQMILDPVTVYGRLTARHVSISIEQVESIYQTYGLKKTAG